VPRPSTALFPPFCRNSLESLLVALTTNYHLPCRDLQRSFQSLSLSPISRFLAAARLVWSEELLREEGRRRKSSARARRAFPYRTKAPGEGPIQGARPDIRTPKILGFFSSQWSFVRVCEPRP
jgi:hypothetical protein